MSSQAVDEKTTSKQTRESSHAAFGAVKDQAHALAEDARELGRLSKEAAREEIQHVRTRGGEAVDDALEHAKRYENSLAEMVRERPLRSVAYAAGAGLLLGYLFRR